MSIIIYREDGLIISLVNVKYIEYNKRGDVLVHYGNDGIYKYRSKYIRQIKITED